MLKIILWVICFENHLHILNTRLYQMYALDLDVCFVNIFSKSVTCVCFFIIILLTMSFLENLILIKSNLLLFFCLSWIMILLYFRNLCVNQGHTDFLMFSSRNFITLDFTLRCMIHFYLIFYMVHGIDQSSCSFIFHIDTRQICHQLIYHFSKRRSFLQ